MGKKCCCCISTDLLIVTCDENQATDDPYDVYVNGNYVLSVPSVNEPNPSNPNLMDYDPGQGAWIATDATIRPDTITNGSDFFPNVCDVCIDPGTFQYGTISKTGLPASIPVVLTATADANDGDWGTVAAFGLKKVGSKWEICASLYRHLRRMRSASLRHLQRRRSAGVLMAVQIHPHQLAAIVKRFGSVNVFLDRMGIDANGTPLAPRSEAQQAACLAVCHACPHLDKVRGNCSKCGCPRNQENLLTVRLATGICPLRKWPPRQTQQDGPQSQP